MVRSSVAMFHELPRDLQPIARRWWILRQDARPEGVGPARLRLIERLIVEAGAEYDHAERSGDPLRSDAALAVHADLVALRARVGPGSLPSAAGDPLGELEALHDRPPGGRPHPDLSQANYA